MPTAPAPVPANTYIGTDSVGRWSLSLDDSKNSFTYTGSDSSTAAVSGSVQASHGFLNLGQSNGVTQGYALEIPGRLVLLRPGDTSAPLIVAVPQTTCYTIPYRLRFDYIDMEAGSGAPSFSGSDEGTFVLNTDSTGANLQFQDLAGSNVSGANSFAGACTAAGRQAELTLQGQSLFNVANNSESISYVSTDVITTALTVGPSGIFVINQTDTNPNASRTASAVGVFEPTAPLSTTSVAAGSYLGFMTEAPVGLYAGITSPISFGGTASSGTTMTGGLFPNDDVTQTPASDTSISLGSQDGVTNGIYLSATVTKPDPNQNCITDLAYDSGLKITPGMNAQGYPICTFPAIAVVGDPEGKYIIFLDSLDYTANVSNGNVGSNPAPMQIYLSQQ